MGGGGGEGGEGRGGREGGREGEMEAHTAYIINRSHPNKHT